MSSNQNTPRWLAAAFLLQAFASAISVTLLDQMTLLGFIPNLPFKISVGLWLLFKGIQEQPQTQEQLRRVKTV